MSSKEPLDGLIPKAEVRSEVTESKSETEAVTIARIKSDTQKFFVITAASILAAFTVIIFLMMRYDAADAEAKGKMVTVFASIVTGALGIVVGRKS